LPEQHLRRLKIVAALCPTWIQTCMLQMDGKPPAEPELAAYLDLLGHCQAEKVPLQGVLLYGLARAPQQPEGPRLSPVSPVWLEELANRIRALGLDTRVTP